MRLAQVVKLQREIKVREDWDSARGLVICCRIPKRLKTTHGSFLTVSVGQESRPS